MYLLPTVLQAHLLQYPSSVPALSLRAALAVPAVILSLLWSSLNSFDSPRLMNADFFCFSVAGVYNIMKALEFAFCDPTDFQWIGEQPVSSYEHTLLVLTSLRGVGFKWGPPKEKLPAPLPRDVSTYIKRNLQLQLEMMAYLSLTLLLARLPDGTWQEPPWPKPESQLGMYFMYWLQALLFGVCACVCLSDRSSFSLTDL